jgi:hypothetical protein
MLDEIISIETRARSAGLRMGDVVKRAGLAYSTWTRWKLGSDPQLSHLRRVEEALDAELEMIKKERRRK